MVADVSNWAAYALAPLLTGYQIGETALSIAFERIWNIWWRVARLMASPVRRRPLKIVFQPRKVSALCKRFTIR